jgi:hypothetical protein
MVGHSGDLAGTIAQLCQSRVVSFAPGVSLNKNEKSVVVVTLTELSEGYTRKGEMLQHGKRLMFFESNPLLVRTSFE